MNKTNLLKIAADIKLLISDVDGVLTDGQLYYYEDHIGHKAFHVHDGFGLLLLKYSGLELGVITAGRSPIVSKRMQALKIEHVYLGQTDKIQAYEDLINKLKLSDRQVAYVGDDLPDLPLIQRVGLGIAVANAAEQVKAQATWITTKSGGNGAIREVCDLILEAQDKLPMAFENYRKQHVW